METSYEMETSWFNLAFSAKRFAHFNQIAEKSNWNSIHSLCIHSVWWMYQHRHMFIYNICSSPKMNDTYIVSIMLNVQRNLVAHIFGLSIEQQFPTLSSLSSLSSFALRLDRFNCIIPPLIQWIWSRWIITHNCSQLARQELMKCLLRNLHHIINQLTPILHVKNLDYREMPFWLSSIMKTGSEGFLCSLSEELNSWHRSIPTNGWIKMNEVSWGSPSKSK